MSQHSSRHLQLDTGINCHVLEWDPGTRDTVIVVHGYLDTASSFAPMLQASALTERFHVVCPDMRGHGKSARVGAGGYYHFFDYIADLEDLIRKVARERVFLVGHSMGGAICAYFTGAFPDRVEKLVLLEGLGPPHNAAEVPDQVATWVDSWRRSRDRGNSIYPNVADAAARLRRYDPKLSEDIALTVAKANTHKVDGGIQFDHDPVHLSRGPMPFRVEVAEQFWRRITCPVLLVDGSESTFRNHSGLEARAKCIANHRIEVIDGAGHMMHLHKPAETAKAVNQFLAESR